MGLSGNGSLKVSTFLDREEVVDLAHLSLRKYEGVIVQIDGKVISPRIRISNMSTELYWYLNAVFYELNVRAFYDSNGDGHGDLAGLTSKLDYLQDLGVDAIWLLPIYPSPLQDDGYDIADYHDIHPDYGNLDDFKDIYLCSSPTRHESDHRPGS